MSLSITQFIKNEAEELGFFWCGISKAKFLNEEAPRLENFLNKGFQGEMKYLENHFDKRLDPTKLVDGAKSVISFAFNYYSNQQFETGIPKISKYAYGEDYHEVIKKKLQLILLKLQQNYGAINGRCFVDSAPVLDRAWAKKSGLGWIGKNTMLINPKAGSYFFLAELIIDCALEYDDEINKDYCGTCTKCVDACPTQAINGDKTMDGSKCISYFTIELKNEIPISNLKLWNDWVFGCDICQDVCPWNRFAKQNNEPAFKPLFNFESNEWSDITNEIFKKKFSKSALKRAGFDKLKSNIQFVFKPKL
ncbi:MAG: tRNA epoxyqueuosine(34) reductase QueG [Bacteroidota bacterium]|jgi:epoxyqueuosine reductase